MQELLVKIAAYITLIMLAVGIAQYAHAGVTIPNPTVVTHADVSVGTSGAAACAVVLSASANNNAGVAQRICGLVQNTGTAQFARCGDSATTSARGIRLAPASTTADGGQASICATNAITCCAESSTTTIAPTEVIDPR